MRCSAPGAGTRENRSNYPRTMVAESMDGSRRYHISNLQQTELDGYLNNIDDPEREAEWRKVDESIRPMLQRLNEIGDKLAQDRHSRLHKLCRCFDWRKRK
jgi:hypothetical protein